MTKKQTKNNETEEQKTEQNPAVDQTEVTQEEKVNDSQRRQAAAQREFANYQQKYRLLDLTSQATNLAQRYADLQRDAAAAQMEADISTRQVTLLSGSAKRLCVQPA